MYDIIVNHLIMPLYKQFSCVLGSLGLLCVLTTHMINVVYITLYIVFAHGLKL